jgi:hypothetical protein
MDYQHGTTWPMHNGQREVRVCHDCGRPIDQPCVPVFLGPHSRSAPAPRPRRIQAAA